MDSATIIAGIGFLLICTIPFFLMSVNNRKREKKLLKTFFRLAEKSDCNITRHDLWGYNLIGLDESANELFFIRKVKDSEIFKQVDLAEIQKCRVVDNNRTVANKDGNHKVTDQVAMALTYLDKNKKETTLEFYNVNYDGFTLRGELLLATKWSAIVNEAISGRTI